MIKSIHHIIWLLRPKGLFNSFMIWFIASWFAISPFTEILVVIKDSTPQFCDFEETETESEKENEEEKDDKDPLFSSAYESDQQTISYLLGLISYIFSEQDHLPEIHSPPPEMQAYFS